MKETQLNQEQLKIAEWLKTVRFRKQFIGGVSEQDVWQKIEQLNKMYESALVAERARYDALLKAQSSSTRSKQRSSSTAPQRRKLPDE